MLYELLQDCAHLAGNNICKKVVEAKQGNECRLNMLANTGDEIRLGGAVVIQDTVNSCKETPEAVLKTQGMERLQARVMKANRDSGAAVPTKELQMIEVGAEAALSMKRTGPEDSRSLAEALHQLGEAQAYAGNMIEPVVPLSNTIAILEKRKKNQEKLSSSHGIDRGVVDLDDLMKDIGNSVSGQRDTPKNQSGKMVATLGGRTDSIKGRADPERRCCQDTRRSLQTKDIRGSDQGKGGASIGKNQVQKMEATGQGESGSKDSQAEFLHIRAPGQPHTKGL